MSIAAPVASGVALGLGLFHLAKPSIWLDEAFTARAINYPYPDLLLQYHWLFYSVEKGWTSIAGTSEWALRMPAVVGAMLACAFLVVLANRLFDGWVAIISGLLLASNPFFVQWSQQARGYTFIAAASILAVILLLNALNSGSRSTWLAYGFALSFVLMAHPISGLVLLPSHAVLIFQRRDRVTHHVLLAGIIVLVLGFSWAGVVAAYTTGTGSPINFPTWDVIARAFAKNGGGLGLGVIIGFVGIGLLRRTGRTSLAVWLGVWALAPFVIAVIGSFAKPIFLDRYLLVTAPAYALLAGIAVRELGPRVRLAVSLALVAVTSVGLVQWYANGAAGNNWHGENWRAAVETVYEARGHKGPILVAPFFSYPASSYYGASFETIAPDSDSVWALVWSESGHELSASTRRELGLSDYRLRERLQFGWRLSAQHWVRGQ